MRRSAFLLALLLAAARPAAGGDGSETGPKPKAEPFELAVLTVNGRPITLSHLILRMGPRYRKLLRFRGDGRKRGLWTKRDEQAFRQGLAALRLQAARTVVFTEILRSEAEKLTKMGFGISERQVEKHWRKMLKRAGGPADLARDRGLSVAALKDLARDELLAEAYQQTLRLQLARPTPQEVADYYRFHREIFRRPESVRARVIFVRRFVYDEKLGRSVKRENARKRAGEILAELKKGVDFEKLARRHSEDPASAARGGLLGSAKKKHLVERGRFEPGLDGALFGTRPGELSGVVEGPANYYLVRVLKHFPAGAPPLEEIEEEVFTRCYYQRIRQAEEKLFRESYRKVLVLDAEGKPVPLKKLLPERKPAGMSTPSGT